VVNLVIDALPKEEKEEEQIDKRGLLSANSMQVMPKFQIETD